jgi:hypothetical protein
MTAVCACALDRLRSKVVAPQSIALPLSGLSLRPDPAGTYFGTWSSPRDRMLELDIIAHRPGAWLGLHLPWPFPDLSGLGWIGFAARCNARSIMAARVCVRSGSDTGFQDHFFPLDIVSTSAATDHSDLISPRHVPGLSGKAAWRELVFFLPPAKSFRWALQDLRLIAL